MLKFRNNLCQNALSIGRELNFAIFALLECYGAVAQLVEQRTENPCVGGSIPSRTTT